ncbi:hypothetical protein Y032_0116g572 [Ancylostoma ceylanicum]|uniref:Uncharacterized protein n=1 Tax=Ancylostoma ceylanicum TaxID=53326 RepID=A0A016TCG3_9BILA|nr:hypothetical protein Y032_0116g572 [Ancylostoma ceylanicum]
MAQVLKHIKNVRVGVVVVSHISFVAFQMNSYENIKGKLTVPAIGPIILWKQGKEVCYKASIRLYPDMLVSRSMRNIS